MMSELPSFSTDCAPMQLLVTLSKEMTSALKRAAGQGKADLCALIRAGWAIYLSRALGQTDVSFASAVSPSAVTHAGAMHSLKSHTHIIPLCVSVNPWLTVEELLRQVHHPEVPRQYYSIDDWQLTYSDPLLHTLLAFEEPATGNRDLLLEEAGTSTAGRNGYYSGNYSLIIVVVIGAELELHFGYQEEALAPGLLQAAVNGLVRVLEAIATDLSQPSGRIETMTKQEKEALLTENTAGHSTAEMTLCDLFEAEAGGVPDATAVVHEGNQMSYRELNEHANRIAHYLISLGIGPEDVVGVCLPKSAEMIAALLGILKAGAAYLPLDPQYPKEFLAFTLTDAKPARVLTRSSETNCLPPIYGLVLLDEPEISRAVQQSSTRNPGNINRVRRLYSRHPAYVIYTSGSTGKPKGVIVTHSGIASLQATQRLHLRVTRSSRILQFSSLSFDASVWEICMALLMGAALVLDNIHGDISMVGPDISHITIPPAVLSCAPATALGNNQTIVVAGESCGAELAGRWSKGRLMLNAYGPTEATICATISGPLAGTVVPPIGKPVVNAKVYVLDKALRLLPAGMAGELYISGAGLARGYLRRAALTAERFVANPFEKNGSRMYRTGDMVRWREDGNLEFLGRADQQVKIRGYRIEPGEIESTLMQHDTIAQAAVIALDDSSGARKLVAYVVAAAERAIEQSLLLEDLRERLPSYMVPAALVEVPRLPLTPNGKLDRKKLPMPTWPDKTQEFTGGRAQPVTEIQRSIRLIWQSVLKRENISIFDNFFDIGGDSLLSVAVAAGMRDHFKKPVKVTDLFRYPTIASFAEHLIASPEESDREFDGLLAGRTRLRRQSADQPVSKG
jgi:amino acid adenylation domain-containing protein